MKESRTKYSKFNKGFLKFIDNIRNFSLSELLESTDGELVNIALTNSLKSFIDFSYENIFIETEELYEFLRDTKIITHGDISAQLYTAIENRKYAQLDKIDTVDDIKELRTYNFMIYAPINVINTALAVTLYVTDKQLECPYTDDEIMSKEKFLQKKQNWDHLLKNSLCWTDKADVGSYYITLTEEVFSRKIKEGWDKKSLDDFHIIMNVLFYMNAFPDYVHEGVPKRAVLDSEVFHKKRITLAPNIDFLEKIKKSPHLRRGHFRTYSSDYFTNMKGKTSWIDPVFVKGNSITVEDGISI
jgi:hypothetical protein